MAATGSCGGSPSYRNLAKLSRSSPLANLYRILENSKVQCDALFPPPLNSQVESRIILLATDILTIVLA